MIRPHAHRAAVLLLVLWAITVLSLVAGGLSFALKQDLAIANLERDRLTAHWAARAGVERAVAELMDDALSPDTLDERWADSEGQFKDVALTTGSFRVLRDGFEAQPLEWFGAGDESAKLNVNVATREQFMRLPHMTPSIAAAIIDWRDADEQPEPDGIERGHYESQLHPYTIRNGPLRTIRELLLVRGVTPELFYGEDTNCNGRLDAHEDDGQASEPPDNSDGRLDRGWYAYLTVCSFEKNEGALGQPRVNLKNADARTLSSRLGLEDWAAESIVRHRQQNEFRHLVDLLNVQRATGTDSGGDGGSGGDAGREKPVTNAVFRRIVDDLTLSDDRVLPGRVNLNTAPREVLVALAGEEIGDAIVRQRESGGYFETIGDLLDVAGVTQEKFGELENAITVRSSVFHVLSVGTSESGLAEARIECIVDRSGEVPRYLYWLESTP